jgi:glucose dehydrogenase
MIRSLLVIVLLTPVVAMGQQTKRSADPGPQDWASYNYDVLGTRHNVAEKTLTPSTVGHLVEKWRFPPRGSFTWIGAVHATPVVVNGYVYVGTATLPTFYKLTPDGKVRWSYQNRDRGPTGNDALRFGLPGYGFINSPLVTADTVFVCDVGGFIYALDRFTGKERWKVNTRVPPFPGAHSSNCIFSAPVLAEGKLLIAGGGFEHGLAADPKNRCCDGRGFVAALDPATGKTLWKYDVGPEPKKFAKPLTIRTAWGERTYHCGPATSSVWSTPSYDATTGLVTFGTDAHNAPREPTPDNPELSTPHSCAVIALDIRTGAERWVTQINKGDLWNYAMPGYDPATGRYKDQSIGDTPKPYTLTIGGKPTRVVGVGCKDGGFYVLEATTGKLLAQTPVYKGPPVADPGSARHPRTLALPGLFGGLQTGCATDGRAIFTNGSDSILFGTNADPNKRFHPPTGGRVVSLSLDLSRENWRHERPKVPAVGGTRERPAFTNVGDPVASGVALAGGVAYFTTTVSNQLVAVDAASGKVLKELPLGPVWCGPSVSRGRVYVGTGNLLFSPLDSREAYFPKSLTGAVYCFGLPGEDAVSALGKGDE